MSVEAEGLGGGVVASAFGDMNVSKVHEARSGVIRIWPAGPWGLVLAAFAHDAEGQLYVLDGGAWEGIAIGIGEGYHSF